MVDVRLQTAADHIWAGGLRFDAEKNAENAETPPPLLGWRESWL